MKKRSFIIILSALLLLSACGKSTPPEAPATALQDSVEKAPDYGSVFAHTNSGDFYYRCADGKTHITFKTTTKTNEIATLDGVWRFSLLEQTQGYPFILFDGYMESEHGYKGSVFMFTKQTEVFAPVFKENTSNAVLLPTDDENYADLAWVLLQTEEDTLLCPTNLRDGSTETGQIVSLAETEYAIEAENVLVCLRTDVQNPLMLRIENKAYSGSSVLSTAAYIYDFSENKLSKIGETDQTEEEEK